MANGTVKMDSNNSYYGQHLVRVIGAAINSSQILASVPWRNPSGQTPTVSNITGAIAGVGDVTVTLDTTRTNEDAVCFVLSHSVSNHQAYFCQLQFTLS